MPRYRIYCAGDELDELPEELEIEERYGGFVVVSCSKKLIESLRGRFPFEPMPSPKKAGTAGLAARTAEAAQAAESDGDVVVRFGLPVKPDWLAALEKAGFETKAPFGGSAVVGRCRRKGALQRILALPAVAQVDAMLPKLLLTPAFFDGLGMKVSKGAIRKAVLALANRKPAKKKKVTGRRTPVPGEVVVVFSSERDRKRAESTLRSAGLAVRRSTPTRLIVSLLDVRDGAGAIGEILDQPGVQRVEEKQTNRLANDVAREIIGGGVVSSPSPLLTGAGEIVAVCDNGIDTGDPDTVHLDFHGRVAGILSYPNHLPPQLVTNPGADDGAADRFSGHGTHVAGSVLGNGAQAQALGLSPIRGMAPAARLLFQAVEQVPQWTNAAILYFLQNGIQPPQSGLYGIPDDLTVLFQQAHDRGARIHSNSWGGGQPGAYDSQCEDLDRFVWEHRDFLILVAAGNSGADLPASSAGIDPGSVDSPGTAKNCITVGASENDRSEFDDVYGQWWPVEYPRAPFQDDPMTDSSDDVVAFSSRGPCSTGRRKPDLVTPGTFVLSTRSSQMPANNFAWHAFPPAKQHYMFMGGTSMATPLAAGSAALLREHLRKNVGYAHPTAAMLKAGLIHAAQYTPYRYAHASAGQWADNEQGFGRLDLRWVVDPPDGRTVYFFDFTLGLVTGDIVETGVRVADPSIPLRATLVYTDYPGENLVNNLNLFLISPSGTFHVGNDFDGNGIPDGDNNAETVVVENPETGWWTARVVASEILQPDQDFAGVLSGGLA